MSSTYADTLRRLVRVPGVRGALVADRATGVAVAAELVEGVDRDAVAALAGAVFNRSTAAVESAGLEPLQALQIDAEQGHLVLIAAGDVVVAVMVQPQAQLGAVRVEARRVAEALA